MVSGQADEFSGRLQIVHPDYVLSAEEFAALPAIEPVYPLTYGISNRMVLKAMAGALERLPELPEWLDPAFVMSRGWDTFSASLARVHRPESLTDLNPAGPARARLAVD
ncbi:MAG: ATP-dependent DNA helicase RecG, partial [Hyphomicrobiales bacterium]